MTIRQRLLYFFAFVTTVFYLSWRILRTIPWDDSLFSIVFGLLLWSSELISSLTAYIIIWNKHKDFKIEKPEIAPERYPHVDVLIATHNEDPELLYKTINACTYMVYPDKQKVHIYVCDDTNRPAVAKIAEELGVGYFGLSENKHAKSGNLNNALSQTNSPLVATFDADMIPYKDFLMETVPYFVEQVEAEERGEKPEKKIGLIQTPQSFYNLDIFQFNLFSEASLPNEQDFFSKGVNVLNNARGASVYTGSNTVLYRKAIDEVGGFPVNTITEDFELGVRMNTKGYSNYSTNDQMASGLTPIDFKSVIKQRIRWGRGVIKSSYNLNIFFNPKLTLSQKIVYINGYLYWWSFFRRLLYIMAPILFTVFHVRVVVANVWLLLFFWLPSYVLTRLSMSDVTTKYRTQIWGEIVETILAPYLVFPLLLESFGISEKKFKVTRKSNDGSRWEWLYAMPYVILWILAVYGLITFNYGKFGSELFYGSVISFWLIHHITNLTFAIFCTMGRVHLRNSERFRVDEPIQIEAWGRRVQVRLNDVSETGCSFFSEVPLYFPKEMEIKLYLQSKDYAARAWGRVVRLYATNGGWFYGVQITKVADEDRREFYQFIYDRVNDQLPQTYNTWVTVVDDLFENINRRFFVDEYRAPVSPSLAPMVTIAEHALLEGQEVHLKKTDFEHVFVSGRLSEDGQLGQEVQMSYGGLSWLLELVKYDASSDETVFAVKNLDELLQKPAFQEMMTKWEGRGA